MNDLLLFLTELSLKIGIIGAVVSLLLKMIINQNDRAQRKLVKSLYALTIIFLSVEIISAALLLFVFKGSA